MRNFLLAVAAIALVNLIGVAGVSATTTDGQTAKKLQTRSGCGVGWNRNPQGRCVPK